MSDTSQRRGGFTSAATTRGIRVEVKSTYLSDRSSPKDCSYLFAYHVRISNVGSETAQLVSREWIITVSEGDVERVAYLDLDVHHGDGPQAVFWREPRVLTVSIHESGTTLFPGTGGVEERGAGAAAGTKVNVPLPAGTGDEGWLRAITEVAAPTIRAFAPDILVTQLGCDTHHLDPLAHLRLTRDAYREAGGLVHDLAHEVAGGRWLATGGGGYERVRVVPLAWTIWFAAMRGVDLPDAVPAAWRDGVRAETGIEPPATFSEPPLGA